MLKGKKAIIVAAVLGFMAGNMVSVPKADAGSVLGNIGKAVKTGGIVWLVDKYGNELNTFINKLTAKYPVSDSYATKVVPIIAVGSKGYVGAAQISGRAWSMTAWWTFGTIPLWTKKTANILLITKSIISTA